MKDALVILLSGLVLCGGSGCVTNQRPAAALYRESLLVTKGMTRAEVYAIIKPAPVMNVGTFDGNQLSSWHSGTSLGNEDYTFVDVVFGKDDRVVEVSRETGHGHEPHDLVYTWW